MSEKIRKPILIALLLFFGFTLFILIRVVSSLYSNPSGGTVAAFNLIHGNQQVNTLLELTGTHSPTPFQPLPTETPTPTATSTPTATPTSTPTHTPTPMPTNTPAPTEKPAGDLPSSALIEGIKGYAQSYSLTCESRSAVDWARYFGVSIDEMDFQSRLPLSDNPETGFVGNYNGYMGQVPPASYGVHAPPVAALLREYGLTATAVKDYSLDRLKKEIANGNPVIVWVIGNVWYGEPIEYLPADGSSVTVAHFEHTAIVIGYDEYGLTFVDNDMVYWRSTQAFLDSWAVLGNTAIVAR